jgi:3-oxoadipate enol-lactonase / 4-carboxymuconolactone decarboxylase
VTVALNHRVEGPPGAPPVVFSTSIGTSLELWDPQAAALQPRFRVVRYDHRGHGESPVPPGPYTLEQLAADALALLDRLELERVTWCGLSLGGMVGMTLALTAPGRIERLVLACTGARIGTPEVWFERAATAREQGMDSLVPPALERWVSPAAPLDTVARLDVMLRGTPPAGYAACCEAIAGADLRGRLGAIAAPTLLIAAADDPATPPVLLEQIGDEIPDARLRVLDGVRHLPNAERPDAFNHLLLGFLDPGMRTRREVLGDAHVDAAIERTTPFTADFQDLLTRYAWDEIWNRPGLDRRTRSAITLTALTALGHHNELALHVPAALRNGLTPDEIKEVLLQAAVYCGVPAANAAFAVAQRALADDAR